MADTKREMVNRPTTYQMAYDSKVRPKMTTEKAQSFLIKSYNKTPNYIIMK